MQISVVVYCGENTKHTRLAVELSALSWSDYIRSCHIGKIWFGVCYLSTKICKILPNYLKISLQLELQNRVIVRSGYIISLNINSQYKVQLLILRIFCRKLWARFLGQCIVRKCLFLIALKELKLIEFHYHTNNYLYKDKIS